MSGQKESPFVSIIHFAALKRALAQNFGQRAHILFIYGRKRTVINQAGRMIQREKRPAGFTRRHQPAVRLADGHPAVRDSL